MLSDQEEFEWKCLAERLEKEGRVMEWDDYRMDIIAKNGNTGEHYEKIKSAYSTKDAVNNPEHYTQGGIECIDAIKASMSNIEYLGYLKGNCQKYVWRYRNKGNMRQDLAKAKWYLEELEKEVGNGGEAE